MNWPCIFLVYAAQRLFDQSSFRFSDNKNGHTTGEAVAFIAVVGRANGESSPGPSLWAKCLHCTTNICQRVDGEGCCFGVIVAVLIFFCSSCSRGR